MATKQSTVDFIVDQLISVNGISFRKMFGEYALYCEGKVASLICDNILFVKITEAGKNFVGEHYREGLPYPGAKPWMEINEERIDDGEWLSELIKITADNLPVPKKKLAKKKK
jgi:DNA transformation protein